MERSEEILDRAVGLPADSRERWDCVVALHRRGDAATFHEAADLLRSSDPTRRVLAVDVLAQLGAERNVPVEERPFAEPAAQLLLDHLPSEHDAEVLASIATAFGHLRDPRSIPGLRGLRGHDNERVRFGVVFGLSGVDDDLAVQALIELSADEDAHVRDWATFGLATQIDRDDHVLRSALIARLDDADDATRDEAVRGLVTRGDGRAIPQLLRELDGAAREDPGTLQEALLAPASRTADGRLCAHVDAMEQDWLRDCSDGALLAALQSAIEACRNAGR